MNTLTVAVYLRMCRPLRLKSVTSLSIEAGQMKIVEDGVPRTFTFELEAISSLNIVND